jgi:hypothetical protein
MMNSWLTQYAAVAWFSMLLNSSSFAAYYSSKFSSLEIFLLVISSFVKAYKHTHYDTYSIMPAAASFSEAYSNVYAACNCLKEIHELSKTLVTRELICVEIQIQNDC